MTALDVQATRVLADARSMRLPSLGTILVVLIGLLPFLLAWTVRAVVEFMLLLAASAKHGWRTAGRQIGAQAPGGGS